MIDQEGLIGIGRHGLSPPMPFIDIPAYREI